MMKFSERYAHVPVRSVLQIDSVDNGLRNRLWNLIGTTFFASAPDYGDGKDDYLPFADNRDAYHVFKNLWHNYLKQTTDTIGTSYFEALRKLKNYFLDSLVRSI